MKKVGILTINDYSNYGNRLQNYASQEIIKELGYEVETVVNISKPKSRIEERSINKVERIHKFISLPFNDKVFLIKEKINNKVYSKKINKAREIKEEKFRDFTKKHIFETNYCISDESIPEDLNDKFDFFITGSDQVWNPIYRCGSKIDFLQFADKKKRIAYSPSFGISSIPEVYVEDYKCWLKEFEFLSVREEAGARIIKKLTDRDAEVLLDPTMMLSKEKWMSISNQSRFKPKEKYILTYFLGKLGNEYKKVINRVAKLYDFKVINLGSTRDLDLFSSDPSEFIDYINSSSIFFTDSFHGVVFSIIFEKPFIVCDRVENGVSMSSRIDTLLNKFNLDSRKISNLKDYDNILNVDYLNAKEILKEEQEKTLNYLKKALQYNK